MRIQGVRGGCGGGWGGVGGGVITLVLFCIQWRRLLLVNSAAASCRTATTAARSSAFHGALIVSIQIGIGKGHSNNSFSPTASLSSLYGPLNLEIFQKILLDEECRGGVPRVQWLAH